MNPSFSFNNYQLLANLVSFLSSPTPYPLCSFILKHPGHHSISSINTSMYICNIYPKDNCRKLATKHCYMWIIAITLPFCLQIISSILKFFWLCHYFLNVCFNQDPGTVHLLRLVDIIFNTFYYISVSFLPFPQKFLF